MSTGSRLPSRHRPAFTVRRPRWRRRAVLGLFFAIYAAFLVVAYYRML